jgi:hypothetical protein
MPTSTKYSRPVAALVFKEELDSARQNTVESHVVESANTLDDDVNRIELICGVSPDAVVAGNNYSSNRVVADGDAIITAIGKLDAQMAFDSGLVKTNATAITGTVATVNPTPTFTVNTGTNVLTFSASHGLATAHPLRVKSSGSLPGGLSAAATYYAGNITGTTCTLHTSSASATLGTGAVDITTAGTGTHTLNGAYVIGTGTAFDTALSANQYIYIDDLTSKTYRIATVESATAIVLYSETTQADASSTMRRLDNLTYPLIFDTLPELEADPTTNDHPVRLSFLNTQLNSVAQNLRYYRNTARPVYLTATTFSLAFINSRNAANDGFITKATSTTADFTTTGLNGIGQSANLTGTISVTSGANTVTGVGTTFLTDFQT